MWEINSFQQSLLHPTTKALDKNSLSPEDISKKGILNCFKVIAVGGLDLAHFSLFCTEDV